MRAAKRNASPLILVVHSALLHAPYDNVHHHINLVLAVFALEGGFDLLEL
jgi:hypothetical protein